MEEAMREAQKCKKDSLCNKRKVGAIAVRVKNGRVVVVGQGYNGPPAGEKCIFSSDSPEADEVCIHAEQRALQDQDKVDLLFVTFIPCPQCMKRALDAGVHTIFYAGEHAPAHPSYEKYQESKRLASANNIELVQMS